MKTTSTSNISENKSPKTPGSISKTLLTPCKRIGLSRRWKQSSKSPFISPLSRNNEPICNVEIECTSSNKRKSENLKESNINDDILSENTPSRPKNVPRIKKTRSIMKNIEAEEDADITVEQNKYYSSSELNKPLFYAEDSTIQSSITGANAGPDVLQGIEDESGKTHLKTTGSINTETQEVSASKELLLNKQYCKKIIGKDIDTNNEVITNSTNLETINIKTSDSPVVVKPSRKKSTKKNIQKKSPNNLTRECIVVIGRTLLNENIEINNMKSQTLFESDLDNKPLNYVSESKDMNIDDDDFIDRRTKNFKPKIFENKKTSTRDLRKLTVAKKIEKCKELSQSSNTSFEDEDDDDFVYTKKNLLSHNTKTAKPTRAKTTGSITQKDIDELKVRIKMKKQMLLAKTETKDIQDLKVLIKKWRKGCQDALSELMDIMKKKFPDKHNMDLSELLEMLKIPSELVGYDDDHDCFKSPEEGDLLC